MSTAAVAAIANHLNVSPNQVVKVTELKWVWCVVVRGRRARFVSKKIMDVNNEEWYTVQGCMDRVVFEKKAQRMFTLRFVEGHSCVVREVPEEVFKSPRFDIRFVRYETIPSASKIVPIPTMRNSNGAKVYTDGIASLTIEERAIEALTRGIEY